MFQGVKEDPLNLHASTSQENQGMPSPQLQSKKQTLSGLSEKCGFDVRTMVSYRHQEQECSHDSAKNWYQKSALTPSSPLE